MASEPRLSLYDQALADFVSSARATRIKDEDDERQLQDFLGARASPQEVQAAAIPLKNEAGAKYGSKLFRNKTVISKDWIDNIMGNIQNAIKVGDTLLKGTPESVSMAWFCVKVCARYSEVRLGFVAYRL